MYQFKIVKLDEGGYKFELGPIKMFIDDFTVNNGDHYLKNPDKAIGYFNVDGSIYGVSNNSMNFNTVEEFYESMNTQYALFTTDKGSNHFFRRSA